MAHLLNSTCHASKFSMMSLGSQRLSGRGSEKTIDLQRCFISAVLFGLYAKEICGYPAELCGKSNRGTGFCTI